MVTPFLNFLQQNDYTSYYPQQWLAMKNMRWLYKQDNLTNYIITFYLQIATVYIDVYFHSI